MQTEVFLVNEKRPYYRAMRQNTKVPSLLDDWLIKNILGNPEDTECLKDFLMKWNYCTIDTLKILNNEEKVDYDKQKAIRYDIHGIINDEILFAVEIQKQGDFEDVLKRFQYYAARLLAGQQTRGKAYKNLKKAWLILIADYAFFPIPGMITDESEIRFKKSEIPLTEVTHLSIMKTGRVDVLNDKPIQELDGLQRWAILFGCSKWPEKWPWIAKISEQDAEIRKVVKKMSELTPDYEAYFYDTMLRLAEMDECTMKLKAFEQGKAAGELSKVIKQTLRNVKRGMSESEIAELLDEDQSVIAKILNCFSQHPELTADEITERMMESLEN